MKFPLALSRTITLKEEEYGISSEKYILNHIATHMEQFGMMERWMSETELFYIKMDPLNAYRRKDIIRNILIKVSYNEEGIEITLQTETILVFAVSLIALPIPFTIEHFPAVLSIPLFLMFRTYP